MEAWWMSFSFWLRIYQLLISLQIWVHPLALINLHNKCVQASFSSICVCYLVRCLIVAHLSSIESWQHPQISECAAWHQRSAKPCSGREVWLQHVDWKVEWGSRIACLKTVLAYMPGGHAIGSSRRGLTRAYTDVGKITKHKNGSVNLSDGRGRHHANIPTEPSLQLVIASNGHSSQI